MARNAQGKRVRQSDGTTKIVNKNANGDGSIYESGGRWFATYYDPDGKRRRVSAATRPLVRKKLDAKLAELVAQSARPTGPLGAAPTVDALAQWWLDNAMNVRPNTEVSYRNQVAKISDKIGTVRLEDLDLATVQEFLTALKKVDGLSDHTITNVRARLRQIVEAGVKLGVLDRNPVTDAKPPRTGRPKRTTPQRTLTVDEARQLLEQCAAHPMGAAVALLFSNGIRGAEALGLAWQDIDIDAGTMTIRRSSTFAGKGVGQRLDDPKTERTRGVLALTPHCIELLKYRRAVQDAERAYAGDLWRTTLHNGEPIDLVFTGADGRPQYTQRLNQAVKAVATLAGLDPTGIGTHAGRRTVITVLYAQGVDVAQIRRFVGHADISTTEGYVRDFQRRDAETDRVVSEVFTPATVRANRDTL